MKIGISVNGVLRNYFRQIEDTHTKYFPPLEHEDETTGEVTIDEPIEVKDYDLEKWVIFPEEEVEQAELTFNPDFSGDPDFAVDADEISELDVEKKSEKDDLNGFMYEKCTLEIFGSAEEQVPNAMETLNNLILEFPQHEFIVMSRELGLSIPATYFFLSKTSCMCQNVQFVTDSKDHWEYVDLMVTDHPDIIYSSPTDKGCIIVNKEFNQTGNDAIRIDSVKDLHDVLQHLHTKNYN